VHEDEKGVVEKPPMPPPRGGLRRASRAPHLRLVASRDSETTELQCDAEETMGMLRNLFGAPAEWRLD
jgi:hypothetical protein